MQINMIHVHVFVKKISRKLHTYLFVIPLDLHFAFIAPLLNNYSSSVPISNLPSCQIIQKLRNCQLNGVLRGIVSLLFCPYVLTL